MHRYKILLIQEALCTRVFFYKRVTIAVERLDFPLSINIISSTSSKAN